MQRKLIDTTFQYKLIDQSNYFIASRAVFLQRLITHLSNQLLQRQPTQKRFSRVSFLDKRSKSISAWCIVHSRKFVGHVKRNNFTGAIWVIGCSGRGRRNAVVAGVITVVVAVVVAVVVTAVVAIVVAVVVAVGWQ
jgi:Flp pilus assembly protein TadB